MALSTLIVNWPLYRVPKVDVSSVSLLSARIISHLLTEWEDRTENIWLRSVQNDQEKLDIFPFGPT